MIAAEHETAVRRTLTAWHQGSPSRSILDVADPPATDGRYHRKGERATWYGSSSEAAAWAELARNPPAGLDLAEVRRRMGHVSFDVIALDLTDDRVLAALGLSRLNLASDDRTICQELADIAVDSGFEAVIGPSAAVADQSTLAVFGAAIGSRSRNLITGTVRTPPSRR